MSEDNLNKPYKDEHGWWHLNSIYDELYNLGIERHNQKLKFATTRLWHPISHVAGICGEKIVSLETGLEMDEQLKINGGGEADFQTEYGTIDVKTCTYKNWKDAYLKHPVNSKHWPDWFILVIFDEENKKGRIGGWASLEEIKNAPIMNFTHGPQYSIHIKKLHREWFPFIKRG